MQTYFVDIAQVPLEERRQTLKPLHGGDLKIEKMGRQVRRLFLFCSAPERLVGFFRNTTHTLTFFLFGLLRDVMFFA